MFCWVWGCSLLGRVLTQRVQSLGYHPQHHMHKVWGDIPIIPALSTQEGKVGESGVRDPPQLLGQFEISSSYLTICQNKRKSTFFTKARFSSHTKSSRTKWNAFFDLRFPKPTNSPLFPFINSIQINIIINMNINVCVNIYYHIHKLLSTVMSTHREPCNFSYFVIYLKGKFIAQSPCFLFTAS